MAELKPSAEVGGAGPEARQREISEFNGTGRARKPKENERRG